MRAQLPFAFVLPHLQRWGRCDIHDLPPFDALGSSLGQISLAVLTVGDLRKFDHFRRLRTHLERVTLMPRLSSWFLPAPFAQAPGFALPGKTIGGRRQRAILTVFGHVSLQRFDLFRQLIDDGLQHRDLFHLLFYMLPGKVCGDVIPSEGEKWKIEERKKR
jgi:hypothetical protein